MYFNLFFHLCCCKEHTHCVGLEVKFALNFFEFWMMLVDIT
jgi:hypothetical protein